MISTNKEKLGILKRQKSATNRQRCLARIGFNNSSWYNGRILEILTTKGFGSFQITLRYYNVVDVNSPCFLAARRGQINRVQELLANHEASISDVTIFGDTLLDVSSAPLSMLDVISDLRLIASIIF